MQGASRSFAIAASRRYASTVPNTGSTARDHLANERTWLAWLRSSLAFTALGLGLERFDLLREDLRAAGMLQKLQLDLPESKGPADPTESHIAAKHGASV